MCSLNSSTLKSETILTTKRSTALSRTNFSQPSFWDGNEHKVVITPPSRKRISNSDCKQWSALRCRSLYFAIGPIDRTGTYVNVYLCVHRIVLWSWRNIPFRWYKDVRRILIFPTRSHRPRHDIPKMTISDQIRTTKRDGSQGERDDDEITLMWKLLLLFVSSRSSQLACNLFIALSLQLPAPEY